MTPADARKRADMLWDEIYSEACHTYSDEIDAITRDLLMAFEAGRASAFREAAAVAMEWLGRGNLDGLAKDLRERAKGGGG